MEESAKFCPSCGASQGKDKVLDVSQASESVNKVMDEARTQINNGKQTGKLYMVIGWISTVVSLLFIPVLFGAIAVIMGYLYRSHDEKHGTILMIAGVAGAILGMLFGLASVGY
jgi:uncharacterized membrane protein YvbJ